MRVIRRLAAVMICVALMACGDPVGIRTEEITVRQAEQALEIENLTDRVLYQLTADVEFAARALFAFGPDPRNAVPPATSVRVPYAQIAGYTTETTEVLVFWWFAEDTGTSGFVPGDRIRSARLQLR